MVCHQVMPGGWKPFFCRAVFVQHSLLSLPCSACAGGLFWQKDTSPWFSIRAALSAAFTSLLYVDSGLADPGTAAQLEAFAKTQLDYALGAPSSLEHLAHLRNPSLGGDSCVSSNDLHLPAA